MQCLTHIWWTQLAQIFLKMISVSIWYESTDFPPLQWQFWQHFFQSVLSCKNWLNKQALSDWPIIRVTDSQLCQRRGSIGFSQISINYFARNGEWYDMGYDCTNNVGHFYTIISKRMIKMMNIWLQLSNGWWHILGQWHINRAGLLESNQDQAKIGKITGLACQPWAQ